MPTEPRSFRTDLAILIMLAALMAATRQHYFAILPDASWAVFLAGGYYLCRWSAWAFPVLMMLAVLVDYFVVTSQGMDFWRHYCISPGYWMLIPAYFSLWAGGWWLFRQAAHGLVLFGKLALALVLSVATCQLFAQGGFYWLSDVVAQKSIAGWAKNYFDWVGPYLVTAAMYVAVIAMLHATLLNLADARRLSARA